MIINIKKQSKPVTSKMQTKKTLGFILALWSIQAFALDVNIKTKAEGHGKPIIIGTTNLPDDIMLMVSLRKDDNSYTGQSKTQVKNGSFRAGPFSQKGTNLTPGTYTLSVTTLLPSLQPPSTLQTIGNEGSNLRGPLAQDSRYGGKVIEYETSLKIGAQ